VDPHVKAWTRIDNNVPLPVAYKDGTKHREYMPDFLVITTDDIHWIIEGKADDEMNSEIVRAKRDATRTWLAHVNSSNDVPDTWAYVLASETVVKNVSGSWDALLNAAQTIR
jgi:type III restriction enzyme